MGVAIDVILLAIIILNVIIGYKKGLINVIFNICAFLVAILATLILFKPVSNIIINNTEIDDKIRSSIINNNSIDTSNETSTADMTNLQKYIDSKINEVGTVARSEAIDVIANTISKKSVEIVTGIIIFIAVRIALILLKFLSGTLSELPVIKQFNKAGGIVYGLLKGIIIIYVILTIVFFIVSVNGNIAITDTINESNITKILYENNIIVKYCLLGKNLL